MSINYDRRRCSPALLYTQYGQHIYICGIICKIAWPLLVQQHVLHCTSAECCDSTGRPLLEAAYIRYTPYRTLSIGIVGTTYVIDADG